MTARPPPKPAAPHDPEHGLATAYRGAGEFDIFAGSRDLVRHSPQGVQAGYAVRLLVRSVTLRRALRQPLPLTSIRDQD